MKTEFIPYIEALELKELGFDESCFAIYDKKILKSLGAMQRKNSTYPDIITAPLYQQAFRWFREKHGWISNVWTICISTDGITSFEYAIDTLDDLGVSQYRENFPYKTYEEAELECLKALIEIVKNK
jgi:hypothetical protein